MFGAQAAYRLMRESGGGVIVAITDVAGIPPWPRFAAHGAAKAAEITWSSAWPPTGAATTCASAASPPGRC